MTEFLKTASGGCWQANISPVFKGSPQRFIFKLESAKSNYMGDAIQKQILSDISQCKYFSTLADETTDVSQTEQLSLYQSARRIFVLCSSFFNNKQRSCIYDSHPTISTWT